LILNCGVRISVLSIIDFKYMTFSSEIQDEKLNNVPKRFFGLFGFQIFTVHAQKIWKA